MGIAGAVVTYICTWWVIFFMALPFGVQLDESGPDVSGPGAPKVPYIKQKMLATTLISALVFGIIFALIELEVFSFREAAGVKFAEDYR